MKHTFRQDLSGVRNSSFGLLVGAVLLFLAAVSAHSADPVDYVLTDVRVMYVAEDIETVDWPTIYYLNDGRGCRVDVVQLRERASYREIHRAVPGRELHLYEFHMSPDEGNHMDSAEAALLSDRYPDIILFQSAEGGDLYNSFRSHLRQLPPVATRRFDILKIYEQLGPREPIDSAAGVFLNGRELAARYRERMEAELPRLLQREAGMDPTSAQQLVRYRLVRSRVGGHLPEIEFLSGIAENRLVHIIEDLLPRGPKRITLLRQAREFLSRLQAAKVLEDRARVEAIIDGYRSLTDLVNSSADDPLFDSHTDLRLYIENLQQRTEALALRAAGVNWTGRILIRESPNGPILKFRASLSADGPREIEMGRVNFHPYWDTVAVPIDTATRTIIPHQSFVREYLIDVDPERLEARQPESLIFTAEIAWGPLTLTMRSAIPVGERTDLRLEFEPDFYFVPPVAELDIDRVVAPMNLRAVISKPRSFEGDVKLTLQTARGLFAGAYRQEVRLRKGKTRETIRIPFSISKLFELGLQPQTLTLSYGNQQIDVDTAVVRIASCRIDDKTKVGFLPDTTGQLEDVLNMTDAAFRPLTDRGLVIANLNAYDVIVVGSGAFYNYPSFKNLKDRFEEYVRNGGSLVIFGQPETWPQGVLPVSFIPGIELVNHQAITNRIPGANILSRPYPITESNLLSLFYKDRDVAAAVIAPAERVFVTPTGASLLSVSRLGDGQIIYCGLPLLEMISRLDIDAIHLFANILNY